MSRRQNAPVETSPHASRIHLGCIACVLMLGLCLCGRAVAQSAGPSAAPVVSAAASTLAAAIDSIAPRYDVGLMGSYTLGALASLSLGVFNGEGANAIANRDSTVLWVARATVRPIPVLGLGASGTRDGGDSLRWGVDGT